MKNIVSLLVAIAIFTGCATFYSTVVTITKIHDSVVSELALLYNSGKISKETNAKILLYDTEYLKASDTLAKTLEAYKLGQATDADKTAKLLALKSVLNDLIVILAEYAPRNASTAQAQLKKADKL